MLQQELLPKKVAIRHMLKYIHPCVGRATTDEPPVMGVEEATSLTEKNNHFPRCEHLTTHILE
jgi:hypothetical protein